GAGASAGGPATARAWGARAYGYFGVPRRRPTRRRAHATPAPPLACPVRPQAHPCCSRSPWRPLARAQAVGPLRLEETARARRGATTVGAWRWAGLFSKRARDVGAAGWWRTHSAAASAKAHGRWAVPLCVPEGPTRVPAAARAPWTRRPEETPAWPLGKRSRSGMAERHTRRRLGPRPGTVGTRDRVGALGCGAAWTGARA